MTHGKIFLKYITLILLGICMLTACGKVSDTENNSTSEATNVTENSSSTDATDVVESSHSTEVTDVTANSSSTEVADNPSTDKTTTDEPSTAVERHGALSVQGAHLVDQNGENVQLYGMSTHGLGWYPQFVNYDTFRTLRDDWNTNCVRLALYTAESNGYCTGGDKDALKALVTTGIDYATSLGMYVIVDWHILSDQDPNVYKEDSKTFFDEISATYADYDNILYEICNEPNGYATWDSIKSYADEVIPVIRANDSNAVIIVGTPTWSQDIDKAAASPLEYDNILYALHFYAGTHKDDLRNRLDTCANNGLPIFVSEFGTCDASGNGANDFDSASKWLELLDQHQISYCSWNLANKNESSTTAVSDWAEDDLSESGRWIRDYFQKKSE